MAVRNAQRRERRGTAAEWAAVNPILKAGELGILQDGDGQVQEIRVGDGTSAWADLGDTALLPRSVLTATYAALVDGEVDPDQLPDALPAGGDTGDALVKASGDDGDAEWVDLSGIYLALTPDTVAHGSSGSALEVDVSEGDYQTVTISAACTVTTTGWPASGKRAYVTLEVSMGTAYAVTWPAAVKWHGDEPPPLEANTRTLIVLVSRDGGTTIEGSYGPGRSTA